VPLLADRQSQVLVDRGPDQRVHEAQPKFPLDEAFCHQHPDRVRGGRIVEVG
jgi:hypothetical protein